MSLYTPTSLDKSSRLIGTASAPTMIGIHADDNFAADSHLIPGARAKGRAITKHAFALLTLGLGLLTALPAHAEDVATLGAAARDVIVRHIGDLVPTLAARARAQETLHGIVTGIDERNDRITLRLAKDASSDFKVRDGLVFNAVRDGDQVEITVENIDGARTIVGLKKE